MISTETAVVISVLASVIALVLSVIAFMRKHPNATPAQLDAEVTGRIVEYQSNTEVIDRLETAYQQAGAVYQRSFDTLVSLFQLVAPLTPIKADDAIAGLFEDIQTPESGAVQQPTPVVAEVEAAG